MNNKISYSIIWGLRGGIIFMLVNILQFYVLIGDYNGYIPKWEPSKISLIIVFIATIISIICGYLYGKKHAEKIPKFKGTIIFSVIFSILFFFFIDKSSTGSIEYMCNTDSECIYEPKSKTSCINRNFIRIINNNPNEEKPQEKYCYCNNGIKEKFKLIEFDAYKCKLTK